MAISRLSTEINIKFPLSKLLNMAKSVNLALLLSFLLIVTMAESRQLGIGVLVPAPSNPTVVCLSIYGAQVGDTCFSVAQAFKLTDDEFFAINPNINCNKIFVGQWLCVDGSFN